MRSLYGAVVVLSALAVAGCAFGQAGYSGPGDRYGGGRSYLPAPAQAQSRVLGWPGKTSPAPAPAPAAFYPAYPQAMPYGAYPQAGYPQAGYPASPAYYPQ